MALQDRNTLKAFFRKGMLPSEGHFFDMIDSAVNKVDDGISKNADEGLLLAPVGSSDKLISFFKNIEDKSPIWSLEVNKEQGSLHLNNPVGETVVSIDPTNKVGINTLEPQYDLDVNGVVASNGRVGNFASGQIPADGQWHTVLENLNGCHIYEVVAGVGKKKTGKYGMIHATAMSTFGKSKNQINVTQAHYGVRCNKVQIRWAGTTYDYRLEMRTRCDYEGGVNVQYYISKLWFDPFMDESIID